MRGKIGSGVVPERVANRGGVPGRLFGDDSDEIDNVARDVAPPDEHLHLVRSETLDHVGTVDREKVVVLTPVLSVQDGRLLGKATGAEALRGIWLTVWVGGVLSG